MRPPYEIVLRALERGEIIEIDGHEIGMDENRDIGFVFEHPDEGKCIMGMGRFTFGDFARLCDKIPKDELFIISANNSLNKMAEERIEERERREKTNV